MPLSRRSVLTLPAAFAARSWAAPIDYRDYSRCLPDYLARLAREAAAKRAAALDACTTPALVRARQYDSRGRVPEAIAWYQRAVNWLPPDHSGLDAAKKRLAQLMNRQ